MEVWRILKENSKAQKENQEGFKELREGLKELREAIKKTDGKVGSHWGQLVEALVEGGLVKLLTRRGIPIERTFSNIDGKFNNKDYEFDILAVNGSCAVVVEVKTTLRPEDIGQFIDKLKDFREAFPEYKDKTIHGAMAYIKSHKSCNTHAHRQGLFVIKAVGDSSTIVNEEGFIPRKF